MKKTLMLAAAACALLSASCQKDIQEPKNETKEEGRISLSVKIDDDIMSKAPYLDEEDYETSVKNCQILVFDENGNLNLHHNVDDLDLTSIELTTTIGTKEIYAVINGPDLSETCETFAEFAATEIDLGTNWRNTSIGFKMIGSATCEVSSSNVVTPLIKVSRLTSRVVLQKITNNIPSAYGDLKINGIALTNVVGNQNILGNAEITTWFNKGGRRPDGSIIDFSNGYSADEYELTSIAINKTISLNSSWSVPYLVYGYANNTAGDAYGWDGSSEFTARKTRLVVSADIDGTTYYYPITLNKLERNTTYTIDLTITGFGSLDPDILVEKGSFNASVEISGWKTGDTYTETL